jgi:PAS domain S-box-containing protein
LYEDISHSSSRFAMTSFLAPLHGAQHKHKPAARSSRSGRTSDRIVLLRHLALLWLFGGAALGAVTWACFELRLDLATTAFAYLIVIVLLSLMDSFASSAIFSAIAVGCLDYFFTRPLFSFRVANVQQLLALMAFLVTSLTVTALVRHSRRLGEAQIEQARLLDLTSDTIFVRDMSDVITYWNHGAEELYGWTREEAIGNVAHSLLQTRFSTPRSEIMDTLLRTGRWEGELIHTRRDGTQVIVASRWSLQRNQRGRPFATLETNNDITARTRAEEALRRSQAAQLAEAQKLSLTGSLSWNVATGEIFWSEQSYRIFEYEPGTKLTFDMVLKRVHPDDVALVRHVIGRATHTMEDFDYEHRLLMPDGAVKRIHVVAHTVPNETGEPGFVGAIMDVTVARQAEEQLHHTRAELAHVTRLTALGELSASIAHEVAQPLAAIVTNGDACLRWLGQDMQQIGEVRGCVERMISEGQRATEIVRRIRTLTRRAAPQKAQLEINDVVNEVVSLVQREVSNHMVLLRLKLTSGLPPLLADRVQLQQVLINLVMNGMQAMDGVSDRPRELSIETRRAEARQVVVTVQDCGTGIDEAHANRLFDAFFTTKSEGLGMGLSICRSIVEAHGGRMWAVNSDAGHGAVFNVSLPVIPVAEGS